MTIDEIRALVQMVEDSGVAELEVQQGPDRVRIRRTSKPRNQEIVVQPVVSVPNTLSSATGSIAENVLQNAGTPDAVSAAVIPKEEPATVSVKSPIVGTYYDSPSPGTPSFVKVGDVVSPKQVLCIIESMKLMNEIDAEIAGTIVAKAVENGKPVEYGELLFTIRPLQS